MLELFPLESVHGHEDGFDTFKPSSSASMHGLGNSSKSAVIEYKVDDSTPELSDIQCQQSQKAASVSSTPSKKEKTPQKRKIGDVTVYQERLMNLQEQQLELKRMKIEEMQKMRKVEEQKLEELKKIHTSVDALLSFVMLNQC
ncbi:hypothetical protein DPMN_077761 [Dreissena polymorpha]|uniref:Uncharacterized protein n=3 Tax=Dreissena polymorpha TaxID=45954 RepID=A0A9D4BGX4_DREPO|nr:hypothetical protein DPMN_077761 [Dreissena polymorpha]